MKLVFRICILCIFLSCDKDDNVQSQDSILSASVSFAYSDIRLQDFFANPNKAYVSGYFYFNETLAEDVIFGLDVEWFEGTENPINFAGADWMAFIGLTREGVVWIPTGLPENLTGTPTQDNWTIRNLNQSLAPNTWYKMTITADFNTLKFESLILEVNSTNIQLDLTDLPLQYPNYAPFNQPTLTFYTFSARSKNMENNFHLSADSRVYFDDIEGGVFKEGTYRVVFQNGFENQSEILTIPIMNEIIPLNSLQENQWYYENEGAKINIISDIKRSGNKGMLCDADLTF